MTLYVTILTVCQQINISSQSVNTCIVLFVSINKRKQCVISKNNKVLSRVNILV